VAETESTLTLAENVNVVFPTTLKRALKGAPQGALRKREDTLKGAQLKAEPQEEQQKA
jgi:hypothetical protein